MIYIQPFKAYRPTKEHHTQVAALPYDVVEQTEVEEILKDNPYSFLAIDVIDPQKVSEKAYEEVGNRLKQWIEEKVFVEDEISSFYIYTLETKSHKQCGIVGCFACKDYEQGKIKKHENTRVNKLQERIHHIEATEAHTGPIYMTYTSCEVFEVWLKDWMATHEVEAVFGHEDDVIQQVYQVSDLQDQMQIKKHFEATEALYIADGHHRVEAAYQYAQKAGGNEEEANYFLGVVFPKEDVCLMAYNRVVQDESGLGQKEVFEQLSKYFEWHEASENGYQPQCVHEMGMRYNNRWYALRLKKEWASILEGAEALDTAILQNYVLEPLFKIKNPTTDHRLEFVGGIKGIDYLNTLTHNQHKVAFNLYPTSVEDMMGVADAKQLMPPKSTWFEPKLRSGIFIHKF